jgi:hypothetical protein
LYRRTAAPTKGNVITVCDLSGDWTVGPYYGAAVQAISAAVDLMCDVGKKGISHR